MPPFVKNGITLPGIGTGVKPSAQFRLNAGCDNCELAASFMAQLQPFLMAIQLPLCLLDCVQAIVGMATALKDATTSVPPDFAAIPDSVVAVLDKCPKCLVGWSPFTVCALVRDILDLVITLLNCAKQILSKLLVISLRAGGLMLDPEISIRKTGECLLGLMRTQLERTLVNLDLLGTLLKAISFLIEFTGVDIDITNISFDLADFGLDAPLQPVITIIDTISTMLLLPREAAAQCAALGGY